MYELVFYDDAGYPDVRAYSDDRARLDTEAEAANKRLDDEGLEQYGFYTVQQAGQARRRDITPEQRWLMMNS